MNIGPRHSSPSNRCYWLGFLLNERPFVAFYRLAASTGLAASAGAARERQSQGPASSLSSFAPSGLPRPVHASQPLRAL